MQMGGIVGVLVLATIALVWFGAIVILGVSWLTTGALAGDFQDLLGMVFFALPILLVIAALNLRAAFLAVRDVRSSMPHLHAI
jgi:fumarate reductase subunit C